jgi:hypothetical protein
MLLSESLKLIASTLWQIQDKEDLEKVLEDMLTPSELVEV